MYIFLATRRSAICFLSAMLTKYDKNCWFTQHKCHAANFLYLPIL